MVCLLLAGCATDYSYYTNPSGAGYNQSVFGLLCENCNREFCMSAAQWNSDNQYMVCPYCGRTQDKTMARNRWVYAANQQQAYNNQATGQALLGMAAGMQQAQQQAAANQQQIIQNYQNNVNKQGTIFNPIYIKERQ